MNKNRSQRSKTFSIVLLLAAVACLVLSNVLFTFGTIQHILLSLLIVILSLAAYLTGRRYT